MRTRFVRTAIWVSACFVVCSFAARSLHAQPDAAEHASSEVSDLAVSEIDGEAVPLRPTRLEGGNPFLGIGRIRPGIRLPGGAVWQPSVLISGTSRTALQVFRANEQSLSEVATRLDLYADILLSGTERITLGFQPFHDRDERRFTQLTLNPDRDDRGLEDGFEDEANLDITTAFFEGELGELFPNLDREDYGALDIGFAIGRQEFSYQEGFLIQDTLDAVGITRNNLVPPGGVNLQLTLLYAWDEIHRGNNGFNNQEISDLNLYGFFASADYAWTTLDAELVYVDDYEEDPAKFGGGDGFYWGVSAAQHIGHLSTAFHLMGSRALDEESAVLGDGVLLFVETSMVMAYSDNNVYANFYWGIDEFTSAARGPEVGGPLGRLGILFASQELGRYDTPLRNDATESVGFALGYHMFFDTFRKQLVFELGGRKGTERNGGPGAVGLAVRYQQAIRQRWILQLDVFGSLVQSQAPGFGSRMEVSFTF